MLWLARIALLLLFPALAGAQLTPVSNVVFRGGIALGYTDVATNGMIRWNPAVTNLEFFRDGSWTNVGTGSSGGSGSGFPLTNTVSAGGYGITDISQIGNTAPLPGAFVASDGGTNHTYVYGPRALLTSTELNNQRLADTNAVLYPGQLVRAQQGSANGSIYISTNAIAWSDFNATNINWMPGMVADSYWKLFIQKPTDGTSVQGPKGDPGLDAIGYSFHGPWIGSRQYVHDTNAWITVSHAGRIYETVATSSNVSPSGVGATNAWAVSVDKGDSGTITVYSNFVVRGVWNSGNTYTTYDLVTRSGNEFVVWETNVPPAVGVAPELDSDAVGVTGPHWTLWRARGVKGVSGTFTATQTVYQTFISEEYRLFDDDSTVFNNLPSPTNRLMVWLSEADGTNNFTFAGYAPIGTNQVTILGGSNLYINGVLFQPGGSGITGLTASADSAGVVAYVDPANWTVGTNLPPETDPIWASWLATNIYPAYSDTYVIPIVNNTATVFLSKGRRQRVIPTNNFEVTIEFNSKPTAAKSADLVLTVDATTNLVTFNTNFINAASITNITISTAGPPTSLLLYCPPPMTNEWDLMQF